MVASQIRMQARESLTGKWGKGILCLLALNLTVFIMYFVFGLLILLGLPAILSSIALWVIMIPLGYGYITQFIRLKRESDFTYFGFLKEAFSNFGKIWKIFGNILLKMLPAVIVLIVAIVLLSFSIFYTTTSFLFGSASSFGLGSILFIVAIVAYIATLIYMIPKSLLYVLSYYIAYDNPDMEAREIVEKSEQLMKGHRWAFVWLQLTFIGWMFLSAFTLGIGLLFLIPYILVSSVVFYESLSGNSTSVKNSKVEVFSNEESSNNDPIQ